MKKNLWNLKTRNHDWFKYSTHIETNYGAKDTDDFIKKVKELGNEKLVEEDVKKRKAIEHLMEQVQYVDEKDVKKEEEEKADSGENETEKDESETESQE